MKKVMIGFLSMNLFFTVMAQEESDQETLGKKIEDLTYSWDLEADKLNNYEGLHKFCLSAEYREEVIDLLKDLHHYDSLLYDRLKKAARFSKDHEIEKTIQEIEKFETEYSLRSFLHFLHEECERVSEIEHDANVIKNDFGGESYDGQVYRIETELNRFIKHITKRVDHIRKHVQHLHIK